MRQRTTAAYKRAQEFFATSVTGRSTPGGRRGQLAAAGGGGAGASSSSSSASSASETGTTASASGAYAGVGPGPAGFMPRSPILPPFCYDAFLDVLATRGYEPGRDVIHLAEGEADGPCVRLAQELGAWVLSNDSDFAIFGFGQQQQGGDDGGYKGFVPIDLLSWEVAQVPATAQVGNAGGEPHQDGDVDSGEAVDGGLGDDFQPVVQRRHRRAAAGAGGGGATAAGGGGGGRRSAGPRRDPIFQQSLVPPAVLDVALGMTPEIASSSSSTSSARTELCLHLTIFTPAALADRLRITVNHLPLLATIVGTDHSPPDLPKVLFPGRTAWHERLDTVASAIRACLLPDARRRMSKSKREKLASVLRSTAAAALTASSSKATSIAGEKTDVSDDGTLNEEDVSTVDLAAKEEEEDDEAFIFIASVLITLLPDPALAFHRLSVDLRAMVAGLIEATCHYIPDTTTTRCCGLFPFCEHCVDPSDPKALVVESSGRREAFLRDARTAYALAREAGRLRFFSGYMALDRIDRSAHLENPQLKNVARSGEQTRLRGMAWSILHSAVGRHRALDEVYLSDAAGGDSGNDTANSDESANSQNTVFEAIPARSETRVATEWLRADGSTVTTPHVLPLDVDCSPLGDEQGKPLPLQGREARRAFFLRALQSDNAQTLALSSPLQPLVALVRFCLAVNHSAEGKPWNAKDIIACLTAGMLSLGCWDGNVSSSKIAFALMNNPVVLDNKSCDLVARVCAASIDINGFFSALLLHDDPDWQPIYRYFEGDVWHECIYDGAANVDLPAEFTRDRQACFEAVVDGLEHTVRGLSKSAAKADKASSVTAKVSNRGKPKASTPATNRYDLLV